MDTLSHNHKAAKPLEDQLDTEYAPAWKPEPGEKIVGVVVDISERVGEFGKYPIVTLRTPDGELAVHAFHEVLAGELGRLAPKIGDEVGIKYAGKHPERGYHRYKVRRGGATAEVNWGRYGGTEPEPVPVDEVSEATETALARERDELDELAGGWNGPLGKDGGVS